VWDRALQRVEAVVERQQRVLRKATITASSSALSTVEDGVFGPIGRSATERRFFHFCTVLVLTP